jgi:hypothetical protein
MGLKQKAAMGDRSGDEGAVLVGPVALLLDAIRAGGR